MRAFDQGREAAKRAAGSPTDPAAVAAALGVEVVRWPFSSRILEVVLEGVVALQQGLAPAWERWLIAHALGHHLLHTGAAFHLDGWQWVSRFKAERQAEEFAAGLFAPPGAWTLSGAAALARRLRLPEQKVEYALPLWRREAAGRAR